MSSPGARAPVGEQAFCLCVIGAWCIATLATLILPFMTPDPAIAAGVWMLVALDCYRMRNAIDATGSTLGFAGGSLPVLLPLALALQWRLDASYPFGSILVLVGNLEVNARIVRGSAFPTARARFSRATRIC